MGSHYFLDHPRILYNGPDTIGVQDCESMVKFLQDFLLFTFGEPKTRWGNVFFELKSQSKKVQKFCCLYLPQPWLKKCVLYTADYGKPHLYRLCGFSTYVISCLDRIILLVNINEILSL